MLSFGGRADWGTSVQLVPLKLMKKELYQSKYAASILEFSLNLSVAVRSLQAAVLARSFRDISQTVRISVRPSNYFIGENPPKLVFR